MLFTRSAIVTPASPSWLALLILTLIILTPRLAVAGTVILTPDQDRIDLTTAIETLALARAADEAETPPILFPPVTGQTPVEGYSDRVLWGRVVLHNSSAYPLDRILQIAPSRLQSIQMFQRSGNSPWHRQMNGSRLPWNLRPLTSIMLAFPLHLEPGATIEIVIGAASETLLALYPTVWEPKAFALWSLQRNLVLAMGWGAELSLGLFALALALLNRDWMQLIMASRLAAILLRDLALFGVAGIILWPESPAWDLKAPSVMGSLALALTSTYILFFVPLRHTSPTAWWMLAFSVPAYLGLVVTGTAGAPFRTVSQILLVMATLGITSQTWVCVAAVHSDYRPARYLLPAFIIGMIGAIARTAEAIGLLSESGLGLVTPTLLSVLGHIMFLTAAAERTNLLRRERAEAQAQLLAVTTDAQARLEQEIESQTRELRIAMEQAESANRSKTQFLAQVSHELRTPLHTILGYTELLRTGRRVSERLAAIAEGGRHLLRLIEDLLSFARGEYNTEQLRPEAIYLHQFLRRIAEQGRLLASRHHNHFQLNAAPDLPPTILLDVRRLEQVLLILLSNAANATHHGHIILTLAAAPLSPGVVTLTFAVTDSGQGIDWADQKRIFEPFERGGRAAHDGLGLGLAIGRQIVARMGGHLAVESQPGSGSRFWFAIPVPEADEAKIHLSADLPTMVGYAGDTRSVLVVDDTLPHRRLVEETLSDLGFAVTGVASVADSESRLTQAAYDLVILDQRLGDGSGWQVLRRLRDGLQPAPPVIMLTAMPPVAPADWEPRRGPDAILLKPVRLDALLGVIGDALALTWQHAEPPEPPPSSSPSPTVGSSPDSDPLKRLAELSALGDITGLEIWLAEQRQSGILPSERLDQVDSCIDRFAFDELMRLCEN